MIPLQAEFSEDTDASAIDEFDLVVVGGGIIGAWSLHIAVSQHPDWRILLIERSTVGSGATAHSAGVSVAIGRTPFEKELSATSRSSYLDLAKALHIPAKSVESFWISSAGSSAAARESINDLDLASAANVDVSALTARAMHVAVAEGEVIQVGGSATSYEPGIIARNLVQQVRTSPNVRCWEGADVVATKACFDYVEIKLATGNVVLARRAILAVGPWIAHMLGDDLIRAHGIRIKRVVALHLSSPPPENAAAVFLPDSDAYLMPLTARGEWLFSFNRTKWDRSPLDAEAHVTADDLAEGADLIARYFPELSVHCRGGRAFCDAYAANGEPLIVRHPANDRFVVAGAGAGKGFRLAPGIAARAVSLLQ